MPSVSIIGTAGRGENSKLLTKTSFEWMCNEAIDIIENRLKIAWSDVQLVSGGAAWAGVLLLHNVRLSVFFRSRRCSLVSGQKTCIADNLCSV